MTIRNCNCIYISIKEACFIICKVDLDITFFHKIFAEVGHFDLIKTSSLPIAAGNSLITALVDNTVLPSQNLKLLELFSSTTFSKSCVSEFK